jgi:hypothetical protein
MYKISFLIQIKIIRREEKEQRNLETIMKLDMKDEDQEVILTNWFTE